MSADPPKPSNDEAATTAPAPAAEPINNSNINTVIAASGIELEPASNQALLHSEK